PPMAAAIYADPIFQKDDPRLRAAFKETTAPAKSEELRGPTVSTYTRLRYAGEEGQTIYNLLGGQRSCSLFLGSNASVASVKNTDLSQFRILHFATHGDINNETPELSALVLSLVDDHGRPQEGFLRLNDIYNLKLRSDLVVLSACRTALGRDIRGEGLV